jgi:hypothetical protein
MVYSKEETASKTRSFHPELKEKVLRGMTRDLAADSGI